MFSQSVNFRKVGSEDNKFTDFRNLEFLKKVSGNPDFQERIVAVFTSTELLRRYITSPSYLHPRQLAHGQLSEKPPR